MTLVFEQGPDFALATTSEILFLTYNSTPGHPEGMRNNRLEWKEVRVQGQFGSLEYHLKSETNK